MRSDVRSKASVAVLATGGTIAGSYAASGRDAVYRVASIAVADLLDAVPGLSQLASLRAEQILQIDSVDMDNAGLLAVGRRTADVLADDDVDAAVITHGTDTLEETAYLLHLGLATSKSVVLVGAMRPADAISADGPRNLRDAVAVAASDQATGMGVLVVMNGEIYTARDVTKTHTLSVAALQSPHGPLGHIADGAPVFYRTSARAHTANTPYDLRSIAELPRVDILYIHADMSTGAVDALVESGSAAIICAGMGNGFIPAKIVVALRAARAAGVQVVRASRTGNGPVTRNGAAPDDDWDWIVVDDQDPQKARILMAIAMTRTKDTQALQQVFHMY